MVCDLRAGGEIHADGELIYRDGRFLPSFSTSRSTHPNRGQAPVPVEGVWHPSRGL